MFKVFVDGSSGTTGLRIFDRLAARDDVEILKLPDELRKDAAAKKEIMNTADVVFLCLPDAAAIESAALIENTKTVVLDTSTAHRTSPDWCYGFPELSSEHRQRLESAKRIAVPGCHASGFISVVYPLTAAGILPKSEKLSCWSLTGYSGGGKKMIAQYESCGEQLLSPRQYALTQTHKHLPEMLKVTGLENEPVFAPIVGSYYSGMAVSVPFTNSSFTSPQSVSSLYEIYCGCFGSSPLIEVFEGYNGENGDGFFAADYLSGKDSMQLLISGGDGRFTVTSRFDNLGKGASGAAVQCMNIALGLDEKLSLNI